MGYVTAGIIINENELTCEACLEHYI
jgi:hypothetical protein